MKRQKNDNSVKELVKLRRENATNRRGLRELHQDCLERTWQFFDNVNIKKWRKRPEIGNPYKSGYKSDMYVGLNKKKALNQMQESLFNAHDDAGNTLTETTGLLPYQIKRYRKLFHNNVDNEIEMYFPHKEDFFKSDGSINLRNYLVLNFLDFSDEQIVKYFNISRGSFIYFKSKLNKVIAADQLEDYAEKAYKEWNKMHPKRFNLTPIK